MIYRAGNYELVTEDEMRLKTDDRVILQIKGKRFEARITSASAEKVFFRRNDDGKQ